MMSVYGVGVSKLFWNLQHQIEMLSVLILETDMWFDVRTSKPFSDSIIYSVSNFDTDGWSRLQNLKTSTCHSVSNFWNWLQPSVSKFETEYIMESENGFEVLKLNHILISNIGTKFQRSASECSIDFCCC